MAWSGRVTKILLPLQLGMDEAAGEAVLRERAGKPLEVPMSAGATVPAMRLLMRVMFRSVLGHSFPFRGDLEPVQFASNDGSRLEGAVAEATGASRGVVVLCHPVLKYGCHYFVKNGYVDVLKAMGLTTILFNFKGFGKSELKGPSFFDDVIGAVAYAKARFPSQRVSLLGVSFGGFHAIHALARIDGQVEIALFDSVPPDAANFFKGAIRFVFRALNGCSLGRLCGTEPIFADLRALQGTSAHFIYGAADPFLGEIDRTALLSTVAPERVTWISNAGHIGIFKHDRNAYENFLKDRLFGSPGVPEEARN
jgi:Serine aminopeptidase, S33